MGEKVVICGVPKEKWIKAFADAVDNAISKDDFTDILCFYLYPDAPRETQEDYQKLWDNVDEAFKAIFGFPRYGKE